MNESSYLAAGAAIPQTYVTQGKDARKTHEKHIQVLLQQVRAYYSMIRYDINANTTKCAKGTRM